MSDDPLTGTLRPGDTPKKEQVECSPDRLWGEPALLSTTAVVQRKDSSKSRQLTATEKRREKHFRAERKKADTAAW